MLEILMNKNYYIIAAVAVLAFVLLYLNPVTFQSASSLCPSPFYHSLLLLLVGTGLYVFFEKYQCSAL